MNDKLNKKESIYVCSIEEKDLKAITESPKFRSLEIDMKEKNSCHNIKSNKINNKMDYNLNLNNTIFLNNNRSFSIDLSRKTSQQTFIGNNNGLKTREAPNHSVIKLYNLSPLKSYSIDISKDKKTRNTSENHFSINSKKQSMKMKVDQLSNNPKINNIMKRLSNNNITKENNAITINPKKSQTSTTNTPVSPVIINPGEFSHTITSSTYKFYIESKANTNSKKSLKTNKKTIELDKEILNETLRTSLTVLFF